MQPSSMPPSEQRQAQLNRQECDLREAQRLGGDLAEPRAPHHERDPRAPAIASNAPPPPCSTPSATNGPRT